MGQTPSGDWYPDDPNTTQASGAAPQQSLPAQPQQSLPTPSAAGRQTSSQPDYSSLFQPGYLGTPSTISPAMIQSPHGTAAQYDMNGLLGQWMNPQGSQANTNLGSGMMSSLGAGSTIDALLQGFAPQAQHASNNLNQMLANFGVGGGQAVGAATQLQAQLGAAISPAIAQAIQNSQANTLGASEFQSGQGLQQSLANAQMGAANAGQMNAALANALGINVGNQQQMGLSNQQNDLTAALNNQASANAAGQYNATTQNSTNAANVGQYNQSQQQMINNMLNQYYAQMGAFNNINTAGQSAGNQNAVNYGQEVTTSDPFGQFMGALGQAASSYTGGPRASGAGTRGTPLPKGSEPA